MDVNNVAVIGAGTMGHGIAQVFAMAGLEVTVTDNDASVLGTVVSRVQSNLQAMVEHEIISASEAMAVPAGIKLVPTPAEAVTQVDFVVEAVFEDLAVKRQVLHDLEAHALHHAIIVSNTSSFSVDDLSVVLSRPQRFLVTHFWNPPHLVPLVEVVPGSETSGETVEMTATLLKFAGKHPALVRKSVPGFVGNRLQHAMRREAIAIVQQGIASPEDVDLIARLSFGLRLPILGPLETADLGGLDLTLAIQSYLLPELDRSTEPAPLVRDKVARGELGAKAGKGFYDWPAGRHAEVIRNRDRALMGLVTWMRENGYLDGH